MDGRLTWQQLTLSLRTPFRVAHGISQTRQAHWIRLQNDEGWGEGTIPPYYGISDEDMTAVWAAAARRIDPFPDDPAAIAGWVGDEGPAPARAALDLALHDRIGRRQGVPLYELLGLPAPPPLPTSVTIGIDRPEIMARQAADMAAFPVLKLKLGGPEDVACVAAVRRARPEATLYVDANAAWTVEEAINHIENLLPYDLALIEQPVAVGDTVGMGRVQAACPVPVVADESVQTRQDIEELAAAGVQGVNIKLMKVGGIVPGLAMIRRAQELGLGVMLGCMVETTIGVTAVAHLAGLAHWLDLDAPLLLADDPFSGLTYDLEGRIHLPNRPGIGVIEKA